MADIQLHRDHDLGLARARKVALKWAEHVEAEFGMECTIIEGDTSDTVEFTRSGVSGSMDVSGSHFELKAKLGFLLGAFAGQIEAEIRRQLDDALAKEQAKKKK
jgi:putative polyhydroxyalkanoate system protein